MKLEAITAKPDKQELGSRLEKVRDLMAKQKLDYYVSFSPINIYYLTNFANNVHERPFHPGNTQKGSDEDGLPAAGINACQEQGPLRPGLHYLL